MGLKTDTFTITPETLALIADANRNTVKKHLRALVFANRLAQHGTGKGTWYGRI